MVAELEDGPSVLDWLARGEAVDALFLDIQMPGLTGLDVSADLPRPLPVVFVTAYAEHAVRAFERAATDYLLKPQPRNASPPPSSACASRRRADRDRRRGLDPRDPSVSR